MNVDVLGKRYAEGFFSLSKDEGVFEDIVSDVEVLGDLCKVDEFRVLLKSPSISDLEKSTLIEDFHKRGWFSLLTFKFLSLLLFKGRLNILEEILEELNKMVMLERGILHVDITSAFKLSEEALSKLRSNVEGMTGKKVELGVSVDKGIIGGIILSLEGYRYDGSLSGKLKKMRKIV